MDEWVWSNGGLVLTGETEVLGEQHFTVWVVDGWMSMEQWWNDTDRGNWSTGRKTLYSVGGVWMMCIEKRWNDADSETELLGENLYGLWLVN